MSHNQLAALLLLAFAGQGFGQNRPPVTDKAKADLLRLEKEAARSATKTTITEAQKKALEDRVKEAREDAASRAPQDNSAEELQSGISDQNKKFLTEAPKPANAPPKTGTAAKPTQPVNFAEVKPPPPKQGPRVPKQKPSRKVSMVIDSKELFFHQNNRIALFRGDVHLRSPSLKMDGEEMEVLFKEGAIAADNGAPAKTTDGKKPDKLNSKGELKTENKVVPKMVIEEDEPDTTAASSPAASDEEESQIEKVWVRGKGGIVTILKTAPNGVVTICKSREAYFDGKNGTLLLKGLPEITKEGKSLVGIDESTEFLLDKNNSLSTPKGGARTITGGAEAPTTLPTPRPGPVHTVLGGNSESTAPTPSTPAKPPAKPPTSAPRPATPTP